MTLDRATKLTFMHVTMNAAAFTWSTSATASWRCWRRPMACGAVHGGLDAPGDHGTTDTDGALYGMEATGVGGRKHTWQVMAGLRLDGNETREALKDGARCAGTEAPRADAATDSGHTPPNGLAAAAMGPTVALAAADGLRAL